MTVATKLDKKVSRIKLKFSSVFFLFGFSILAFVLYSSAFQVGYIADDYNFLDLSLKDFFLMAQSIFRPLGLTLFSLSSKGFGGASPSFLHIVGILLHSFNAYLLVLLGKAFTKNLWIGLLTGVLFLAFPVTIEPLYWLSALIFYLPMTSLVLASLLFTFNRYEKLDGNRPEEFKAEYRKIGWWMAWTWALSLMFHEIALVLPVLVGLMIYSGTLFQRPKASLQEQIKFWLPSAAVFLIYMALRLALSAPSELASYTISERASRLIYAIWRSFLPIEKGIWHLVHFTENLSPVTAIILVTLLIGGCLAFLHRWQALRPVAWGLAATLIAALPPVIFSTTGGRYLYLPGALSALTIGLAIHGLLNLSKQQNPFSFLKNQNAQWVVSRLAIVILLAVTALNFPIVHKETEGWVYAARSVQDLENQVAQIMSEAIKNRDSSQAVQIYLVDFQTFQISQAIRLFERVNPGFIGEVDGEKLYLKAPNTDMQKSRYYKEISEAGLHKLKLSGIVLIYCEPQKTVYWMNEDPVPCLARDGE